MKIDEWYKGFYSKNYKTLLYVPLVIVIIALIFLSVQYARNGDILEKDVTLKGGMSVTIYTDKPMGELQDFLSTKFNKEFAIRQLSEFGSEKQLGIIVESAEIEQDELKKALEEKLGIQLSDQNYSVEITGSSLGQEFYRQMLIALLLAFLFMSIVVFISFRSFVPSIAVVLSDFFNITVTIAVINLLGIKVSTAGIAAILLILGYSLDTDVLLTTKVLKRKEGSIDDRIISAMKTGLTMTITTIAAATAGYFIGTSEVFKQTFLIIIIGCVADIFITYFVNAGIMKMYCMKKENV